MKAFDLLSEIRSLVGKKGINPLDYRQTLREASLKRWGNANIIRRDGIGIDEVYDEFKASFPWMFESLDDFVEALANRLSGTEESIDDEKRADMIQLEEYYSSEGKEDILLNLQLKSSERSLKKTYTGKAIDILEEEGLIVKANKKITLSKKGICHILKMALNERK